MEGLLTVESVPAYVLASSIDVLEGPELSADEIHGGNLNYAFQVRLTFMAGPVVMMIMMAGVRQGRQKCLC